jgi:hypothetical protein
LPQNLAVAHYFDTLFKIYTAAPLTSTTIRQKVQAFRNCEPLACQLQSPEAVTQPEHL